MDSSLEQIHAVEEYNEFLRTSERAVIYFRAPWAPPCAQMDVVVKTLQRLHSGTVLAFRAVEVDDRPWALSLLEVSHVPTFVLAADGRVTDRIEGAHAAQLTKQCAALLKMSESEALDAACQAVIKSAPVVLFLKGTPDAPRCGFSRQMVTLMREAGLVFKHVDVLMDKAVRERIKTIAQWPTFPQLFAHGQLIGGLDIARELADAGALVREIEMLGGKSGSALKAAEEKGDGKAAGAENDGAAKKTPADDVVGENGVSAELSARLTALVRQKPVMLFMKGSPDAPQCGFSRKMVALLAEHEVKEYGHFDILTDNVVRQGLKKFSNWPTFPQLYAKGELVGGLDIAKELAASGALREELGLGEGGEEADTKKEESLEDRLKKLVLKAPVMVFMKGEPDAPRCGFSREVVALLREQNVEYGHFDILQDNDVRQGLKTYSQWPTYPQIYANGELVGGLDIAKELASSGALREELGLE